MLWPLDRVQQVLWFAIRMETCLLLAQQPREQWSQFEGLRWCQVGLYAHLTLYAN